MNGTILAGEPSYVTGDTGNTNGGVIYDVGFAFLILLFLTILCYISYTCKRSTSSQPPPTAADSDSDSGEFHCVKLSNGLDDKILSTYPTFIYSETVKSHKLDTDKLPAHTFAIDCGSGCSICLGDYKPADVLRLLPECGHLFHVSCVDVWLKAQPTCPMCRNSPSSSSLELT